MRPYLIANEITPVEVGRHYSTLPLHSTLVHWFWLDGEVPESAVLDAIAGIKADPVRLMVFGRKTFTASTLEGDMPVEVTTLRRTPELVDLHEQARAALDSLGAIYEKPEYVHQGFRPHITHQAGETIDPRGYVSRNLYVATAERPEYGTLRTILAKIALDQARS